MKKPNQIIFVIVTVILIYVLILFMSNKKASCFDSPSPSVIQEKRSILLEQMKGTREQRMLST